MRPCQAKRKSNSPTVKEGAPGQVSLQGCVSEDEIQGVCGRMKTGMTENVSLRHLVQYCVSPHHVQIVHELCLLSNFTQ